MNVKEIDNPLIGKHEDNLEVKLRNRWKVDYTIVKGIALKRTGNSLRNYFRGEMGLSDNPALSDEIFNLRLNAIRGTCNAESICALDRKFTLIQYAYSDRLTKEKFERLEDFFTKTNKERNILGKRGIPRYMNEFLKIYKDKPILGAREILKSELDSIFYNTILEIVGREKKVEPEKKETESKDKDNILGSAFEQFGLSSSTKTKEVNDSSLDDVFSMLTDTNTDDENSIETSKTVDNTVKVVGDGDKSQELTVKEVKSDNGSNIEKVKNNILEICDLLGIQSSKNDFVKKLCNESLCELYNIKNNINAYSNATIKSVLEDFFTGLMYNGVSPEEGYSIGDTIDIKEDDLCKNYRVTTPIDENTTKGTIKYNGWCYNGELIVPKIIEPKK